MRAARQVFAGAFIVLFAVAAHAQQSDEPRLEGIAKQAMASRFKLPEGKVHVDALEVTGQSASAYTSADDRSCMIKLAQQADKHWKVVRQSCEQSSPADIAISMVMQLTGAGPGEVQATVLRYVDNSAIVETKSLQQTCLLKMGRTPTTVNGWVVEEARCARSEPTPAAKADSAGLTDR